MPYTCYYCNKEMSSKETKRCSRCLLVTYCSKECQTASWKASHKQNCIIHPSVRSPNDPSKVRSKEEMPEKNSEEWLNIQADRALSRWMQIWRPLFQNFAAISLNLANHPKDRVMTHCMKLLVVRRPGENDTVKQYQVVEATVARFTDIVAELGEDVNTPIDPTDYTRIRFVLILLDNEGYMERMRLVQWNDPNLDFFRNMDKDACARVGGPDSHWDEALISASYDGTPDIRTLGRRSS